MKTFKIAILCTCLFALPSVAGGKANHVHENEVKQHIESTQHGHSTEANHAHGDHAGPVGSPANASSAQRTVFVGLTDRMRINFSENLGLIQSGEVIQFVVTNEGKIPHEFSIGDQAEQQAHAKMMREIPNMRHEDGNTVTVEPGLTKSITWKFEGDDTVVFACNIPGHYEAGMFANADLVP